MPWYENGVLTIDRYTLKIIKDRLANLNAYVFNDCSISVIIDRCSINIETVTVIVDIHTEKGETPQHYKRIYNYQRFLGMIESVYELTIDCECRKIKAFQKDVITNVLNESKEVPITKNIAVRKQKLFKSKLWLDSAPPHSNEL